MPKHVTNLGYEVISVNKNLHRFFTEISSSFQLKNKILAALKKLTVYL